MGASLGRSPNTLSSSMWNTLHSGDGCLRISLNPYTFRHFVKLCQKQHISIFNCSCENPSHTTQSNMQIICDSRGLFSNRFLKNNIENSTRMPQNVLYVDNVTLNNYLDQATTTFIIIVVSVIFLVSNNNIMLNQ